MNLHPIRTALAAAALCAILPTAADTAGVKLGSVHFKVGCNAAAQREFDLAMAYYHSFAMERMKAPLERALAADAGCGMAHWAAALALLDNPFAWPASISAKAPVDGAALIEQARKAGLATQRERDYVDALAAYFQDADKLNHRTRAKAFEAGLEKVAARYPEDTEATILHGLVLSANYDPADKQYGNQLRAATLLEPVFAKLPEHPGAAHYLIHSYDFPPLATRGLPAAQRYSKIAPAAAHAQHMPSHIFTRVGAWRDSITANAASAQSDAAAGWNTLHAYDYMVYAHLQLGQDRLAQGVQDRAKAMAKLSDHFAAAYAYGAMPARLALERSDWAAAAKLPLTPAADAYPWAKYPQAEASNAYGRALGAAALRDAPGGGDGTRPPATAARSRHRTEDRLLGRADRNPDGRGARLRRVQGRPDGRRHRRPAEGGRPRGREREACRHAGAAAAGARVAMPAPCSSAAMRPVRCVNSRPCCTRNPIACARWPAPPSPPSARAMRPRPASTPTRSRGRPRKPMPACPACNWRGNR